MCYRLLRANLQKPYVHWTTADVYNPAYGKLRQEDHKLKTPCVPSRNNLKSPRSPSTGE